MPDHAVCPHCQAKLKLPPTDATKAIRIRCPKCSSIFVIGNAATASTTAGSANSNREARPARPAQPSTPSPRHPPPPRSVPSTSLPPTSHFVATHRKTKSPSRKRLLWIATGIASGLLIIASLSLAIYGMLGRDGPSLSNAEDTPQAPPNADGAPLFSEEKFAKAPLEAKPKRAAVIREAQQVLGEALAKGDRLDPSSPQFDSNLQQAFYLQFHGLMVKALRTQPESTSLDQINVEMGQQAEALRKAKASESLAGGTALPAPLNDTFRQIDNALQCMRVLPNPVEDKSQAFSWTPEDRRVLSAYWLQSAVGREVAQFLAAHVGKTHVSDDTLRALTEKLDTHLQTGMKLAAIRSAQGNLMIKEPKATIYARQKVAVDLLVQELKQGTDDSALQDVCEVASRLSDAIDGIPFQQTEPLRRLAQAPSWNLIQSYRDRRANELEEKQLAEQEAARRYQESLENQKKARELAEERREQRERELKERLENPTKTGSPLMRHGIGNGQQPGGAMRPPGMGGRLANEGVQPPNDQPPLGTPGVMPRHGSPGSTPGIPPGFPPSSSEKTITLRLEAKDPNQVQEIEKVLQPSTQHFDSLTSNGVSSFRIHDYPGNVSELAKRFPNLAFTDIDETKRTAKVKLLPRN